MNITYSRFLLALALFISIASSSSAQIAGDDFKPSGRVVGQLFLDYYYKMAGDSNTVIKSKLPAQYANTPKFFSAFDFRRVYLGYDYDFTRSVSASLLLSNENSSAGTGDVLADNRRGVYIKEANLKVKDVIPMATIVLGQSKTPTFTLFEENIYGYRSIEKTISDMRGFESSNDLGVAVLGKFDEAGNYGYNVMLANGAKSGAIAETDRYKKVYAALNGQFFDKLLSAEVFADYNPTSDSQSTMAIKGFVALQIEPITVGVEYYVATMTKASLGKDVKPRGISIFAHADIIKNSFAVFGRFDMFDPDNSNTTAGVKENFISAGVDWSPVTNVHVMPNVWMDTYSNKASTGTIPDNDVVLRLTGSFKF